jgi:dihydrofolate synthase / folylpolyglutamate synthase
LDRLDLPHKAGLILTIGGTNGKGSCCAMLESILRAEGYRTGLYTSPHLLEYNERVRVCGVPAMDAVLVDGFEAVEAVRGDVALTYFEQATLAAFWVFARQPLDVLILEVGMGGRLDAVNVLDADAVLLTGIGLDHQAFLGDTVEAIGFEKAGIFRAGRPAVFGSSAIPNSVLQKADELGVPLWLSGCDFGFEPAQQQWRYWRHPTPLGCTQKHANPQSRFADAPERRGGLAYPALRGTHQLLNASAVLALLDAVRDRLPVSMQAIRLGLMQVEWPGRFQIWPGQPSIILDVAHNPQAGAVLAHHLGQMGFYRDSICVLGMLSDKDVVGFLTHLQPHITQWHLCSLKGERACHAHTLAEHLKTVGIHAPVVLFDTPEAGMEAAIAHAKPDDRIVACGSFLTVSAVLSFLRAHRH